MSNMKGFDAAQARYDAMVPADDGPEPSDEHVEEAFSRLLDDGEMFQLFMDDMRPDLSTVFRLFHDHGGLPLRSGTRQDDNQFDALTGAFQTVLDDYRTWLEGQPTDPLIDMSYTVMQEGIDANKADANEYRTDCQREAEAWS